MCLFAFLICPANAQVPSNVLRRGSYDQGKAQRLGTSFTLDVDGRQYLITARHLVAGLKPEDTIDIRKGAWTPLNVKVLLRDKQIDIAVLIPPAQLTVNFALEPNTDKFFYGQDAYFTGFPYGLSTGGKNVNGLYPARFHEERHLLGDHQ